MFDLPQPESFHVERPPLVVAVAQVRFPLVARLQTLAGIASLQDRIAGVLPYMEQVHQQQLLLSLSPLGSAASPAVEQTSAWKFTNEGSWILSIEPGSATLSVGADYTTGDDFASAWRTILEALASDVGVPRCDRIGVRYVDVIDIPHDAQTEWLAWLQPQLMGMLGTTIFSEGTALRTYVTQAHLLSSRREPHPVQGAFRIGFLPQGTQLGLQPLSEPFQVAETAFLLDIDLFIEGHQPFDVDSLVQDYDLLHLQQEQFFLWALTDEGKNHFGVGT
jgi:uncharacterized protein (TIGR04255 family)